MARILIDKGKGRTEEGSDALFWGPNQGDDMAPEELGLREPTGVPKALSQLKQLLKKKFRTK